MNFIKLFLRIRGWWRLKRGYCPLCNSELPMVDKCKVCWGITDPYPPPEGTILLWRQKWSAFLNKKESDFK